MNTFDKNKPYTQRNGRKAWIVDDDMLRTYPLTVKLEEEDGTTILAGMTKDGRIFESRYRHESEHDLVNILETPSVEEQDKKEFEEWVNINHLADYYAGCYLLAIKAWLAARRTQRAQLQPSSELLRAAKEVIKMDELWERAANNPSQLYPRWDHTLSVLKSAIEACEKVGK